MMKVLVVAVMALVPVAAIPTLAGQNDSCQGDTVRHLTLDQTLKLLEAGIPRYRWDSDAALAIING